MNKKIDCIVAGHTCMDLLPAFFKGGKSVDEIIQPGKLVMVGPMAQAMGGAVPNTAGALNRLGLNVCPMGKIGDDLLGQSILAKMEAEGLPINGMITDNNCGTSYTVVLSIPGIDRIPLHYPGVNDTFCSDDLNYELIKNSSHFHLGYPPLMDSLFSDGGSELLKIFKSVKKFGVTTSLDMARPDPQTAAGKANWLAILQKVLPFVDIFTPSIDELLYMLNQPLFKQFITSDRPFRGLTQFDLQTLGKRLIDLGTKEVLIKLGEFGAYYQSETASYYTPCFQVELTGAIGSGDCTIAGFLAARLKGLPANEALTIAVATGACNVEAIDSLSGIPSWDDLHKRLLSGWRKHSYLL
jgi:sugar/nucleoside kinase (ribokinase family)